MDETTRHETQQLTTSSSAPFSVRNALLGTQSVSFASRNHNINRHFESISSRRRQCRLQWTSHPVNILFKDFLQSNAYLICRQCRAPDGVHMVCCCAIMITVTTQDGKRQLHNATHCSFHHLKYQTLSKLGHYFEIVKLHLPNTPINRCHRQHRVRSVTHSEYQTSMQRTDPT